MSSLTLRQLVPGDEARLFEFLEPYVDSSLFFFSNVERAGLEDRGETFQGTYVASFEMSRMTSVVAHCWNGNVMVQGDVGLEQAAVHAVELSGRAVRGFVGPPALTARARAALGLEAKAAAHDSREVLFSLSLDELKVPASLASGALRLRTPSPTEATGPLLEWRIAYAVESLGAVRDAALENEARELMETWGLSGKCWVLTLGSEIVAMTGFNAEARGIVQVGGVYTPPALRGRGYARAAVAGSLEVARSNGATRSVLFTPETNVAAQRAYVALGYRVVGDFGLVLF